MTRPLTRRTPGQALDQMVPKDTGPCEVNLFDVGAGEVVVPSFRLARLRLVRDGDDAPEAAE